MADTPLSVEEALKIVSRLTDAYVCEITDDDKDALHVLLTAYAAGQKELLLARKVVDKAEAYLWQSQELRDAIRAYDSTSDRPEDR